MQGNDQSIYRVGAEVIELTHRATRERTPFLTKVLQLPDNMESVIRVYKPTEARKPDPEAP